MSPPIQWVGIPETEFYDTVPNPQALNPNHMIHIQFEHLDNLDRIHYVLGMFWFVGQQTLRITGRMVFWTM
jgi:hypothetical protein